MYSAFHNNLLQIERCGKKFFPPQSSLCRTLISLTRPSNKLHPSVPNYKGPSNKFYPDAHTYKRPWNFRDYPTGAVEEELITCEKSVYMERSDQLEFMYISQNYRKKQFYYLQDGFTLTQKQWGFYNLQKSKIPFYFSMFLQSGIFHELHKLKLLQDQLKRRSMTSEIIRRTHKPKVLNLKSSMQTVFILFAAMTLLAKIAFVSEFVYSACNRNNFMRLKRKLAEIGYGAKFPFHKTYKLGRRKLCK